MAKKARQGKGTPASPPVANGGEMAQPVRRPNGQLVGQPGSNGGVHRGPDLKPRNIVQAVLMKALTDEGGVVVETPKGKPNWRQRAKVRHALVHNAARTLQRIFEDGAAGDQAAYAPAIRAFTMMHEVLQPAKDDPKAGGGIIPPRFTRPPQPAAPAEGEPSAADEPGAVVDREGNVYVDGDR